MRIAHLLREDDCPLHARDAPPELAVDEVGQPSEGETERGRTGHVVGQVPERVVVFPGIPQHEEDDAGQPAVAGHAAFPQHEKVKRIFEERPDVVEQDVPEPSPSLWLPSEPGLRPG